MRTATVAKLSLTALVGLGSLMGSAHVAQAGPGPVIKAGPAPTTTTTVKPMNGDLVEVAYCDVHLCIEATPVDPTPDPPQPADLPIAQPEPGYCDVHLCLPADEAAPEPGPKCNPVLCDNPAGDKVKDDQGCTTTHGCPGEGDGGTDGGQGSTGGDDGGTDGQTTDGGTDGGTDGVTSDGGETDGGSTGGGGGHLPKTGGDIATILGVGLGLTGVGAAARKLGRRES